MNKYLSFVFVVLCFYHTAATATAQAPANVSCGPSLVDTKCSKCLIYHPGDQILLDIHDKAGWAKIIEKIPVGANANRQAN